MTAEREEVQALLRLRERLERKARRLKAELEAVEKLIGILEREIASLSFKPADRLKAEPLRETPPPAPLEGQAIPLRASDGTLLATMHVIGDEIRVIPGEVSFNVNTPPFQQFLIAKVLNGMASKDREAAAAGQLTPDQILTYRVVQDGDQIKEIVIRNYREERRIATLKNALRWTLEKMYEKTRIVG